MRSGSQLDDSRMSPRSRRGLASSAFGAACRPHAGRRPSRRTGLRFSTGPGMIVSDRGGSRGIPGLRPDVRRRVAGVPQARRSERLAFGLLVAGAVLMVVLFSVATRSVAAARRELLKPPAREVIVTRDARYTVLALAVLLLTVVPVGTAVFLLGFVHGDSPCVMCWEQRIGMALIALIGLFILRYGPRPKYLGPGRAGRARGASTWGSGTPGCTRRATSARASASRSSARTPTSGRC